MIYWFTGQPSSGKTTLGHKLYKFLQTEKEIGENQFSTWMVMI